MRTRSLFATLLAALALLAAGAASPLHAQVAVDNTILLDPFDPVPEIQFRHFGGNPCYDDCSSYERCRDRCYGHRRRCWRDCDGRRHCARDCRRTSWRGCESACWHELGCGRYCRSRDWRERQWGRAERDHRTFRKDHRTFRDDHARFRDDAELYEHQAGEYERRYGDGPSDRHRLDGGHHDGDHRDGDRHDGHDANWREQAPPPAAYQGNGSGDGWYDDDDGDGSYGDDSYDGGASADDYNDPDAYRSGGDPAPSSAVPTTPAAH